MKLDIEKNGKTIQIIPKQILVGGYEIDRFMSADAFDKLLKGFMDGWLSYEELEFIGSIQTKITANELANIILENDYHDIIPKIKEGLHLSEVSKVLRNSSNSAIVIKNSRTEAIIIPKYCQTPYMRDLKLPKCYGFDQFYYSIRDFYGRISLAELFLNDALSGDFSRISEAFDIVRKSLDLKYDTIMDLLYEHFVGGAEIDKKIERLKKSKKYRDELAQNKSDFYSKGIVEIEDGYAIKVSSWRTKHIFLFKTENKSEIPKVCVAEDMAIAKMMRNNKFKQYADVTAPIPFDEFWDKNLWLREPLIKALKEHISKQTSMYDPLIAFYAIDA